MSIISFTMRQTAGEHAEARIRGVLTEAGSKMLAGKLAGETITVLDMETGKYPPVFEGVVDSVDFTTENGLDIAEIHLLAGSSLLDLEQKSKSYQNVNLTYDDIIMDVLKEFEHGDYVIPNDAWKKKFGRPIIRYRETAWEFIRRVASHLNMPVFSDIRSGAPRVYVGVPCYKDRVATFAENAYTVSSGREYYDVGGPFLGLDKSAFIRYNVESGNSYFLGGYAKFKERDLYICGKICRMENDLLVYGYTLAEQHPDEGIFTCYMPTCRNPFFRGMSLLGRVIRTEKDDVRLHLDIDEVQDVETAHPWPWVPETGNLMYLMPRVGSHVSLYFGGDDETQGQTINCIRDNSPMPTAPKHSENTVDTESVVDSDTSNNASDEFTSNTFIPNCRSLTTEHIKSIYLFPDSVGFVTREMIPGYAGFNASQEIRIVSRDGIKLNSDYEIKIIAGKSVKIKGKTVSIGSKKYTYIAHGYFRSETPAERAISQFMNTRTNPANISSQPQVFFVNQTEIHLCPGSFAGMGEDKVYPLSRHFFQKHSVTRYLFFIIYITYPYSSSSACGNVGNPVSRKGFSKDCGKRVSRKCFP